jgi:hypothetical protein
MDPKPQPNREEYIARLRAMGGEARVAKAFELSQFARDLMLQGLRDRFPEKSEAEIMAEYRRRIDQCHNKNY